MYDNLSRVIEVDIDEILPNRFQPRIQFDEEEILELSDSIREHGVIQPLVVRSIGDKYEIIAGERRYKASVLAGKETVPVIVKNLNDKDSAEVALIENIQRKNLTPIEEALSYKKILDMGYITQENLASKLGKSQSAVANKIRLLNLSDEVQEALLDNKISERHARSLLKLSTSKQQNEMLNRIISERLPVRKADEEIEKMKNSPSDDSNDDTQKIIEKGEIDMNNNMFGMPNVPQNPQPTMPSFDIFGSGVQQPVAAQPQQPMVNEILEPSTTPSFDIFAGSTPTTPVQPTPEVAPMPTMESAPVMPSVAPVVPEVPVIQPTMPEMSAMGDFQINPSPMPFATPEVAPIPTMESAPVMPSVAPVVPEVPAMGDFQINPSPMPFATPEVTPMPTMESAPVMPSIEPVIPQTAPIIESPAIDNPDQITQQSNNLFGFGDTNLNSIEQPKPFESTMPEFKMPEPIIVTDYSKQYDPIMPQMGPVAPAVDFKEVISAIRECSNKIEQYGFKIDVEEYDLANLYQVIFKIEK